MKSSANPSLNRGEDGTKPKPRHGDPFVDFQGHRQGFQEAITLVHSTESTLSLLSIRQLHLLKLPIQDVFEATKGQP